MKKRLIEVLQEFYEKKRSLLAFNVQNIYHLQALKEISEELKVPVIAQFSARYVKHFNKTVGFDFLNKNYQNEYVYFHLDHCQDLELIAFCVNVGFDGVMYDGSASPIAHNISITKKVMEIAAPYNCIVEGELGEIGGVEDGEGTENMSVVNLEEVKRYMDETKVDILALGIGNAHGFYSTFNNIDTSILLKAKQILDRDQLFVLHGGSGLPEEMVQDTIRNGVIKINYSTQIKQATIDALEEYLGKKELFNEINFEMTLLFHVKRTYKMLLKKYTL